MRAGGQRRGARPTTPRRGSPRLRGDHPLGGLLVPEIFGWLARVGVDEEPVDLGLAVGRQVALDRLAHDLRPRSALAGPVGVEPVEQLVGELHEGLRARHGHMVAIWPRGALAGPYGSGAARRSAAGTRPGSRAAALPCAD